MWIALLVFCAPRICAQDAPAAAGDGKSYFEPAPDDDGTVVKLPTYRVVEQRILPPPESWLYTAIPGFEVLSNASRRGTRAFLDDFVRFQAALSVVWPAFAGGKSTRTPTLMIICGKTGAYESLGLQAEEADAGIYGRAFFVEDDERSAIVIDYNYIIFDENSVFSLEPDREDENAGLGSTVGQTGYGPISDPFKTLYNQYTRFRLRRLLGKKAPPPWFEEGMARLIETMDFSGKRIEFGKLDESKFITSPYESMDNLAQAAANDGEIGSGINHDLGLAIMGRKAGILQNRGNPLLPMAKLLAPDAKPTKAWSNQCYLFAHMCLYGNRKEYQRGFIKLAMRSLSEPVTEELFKQCLGTSYKKMGVKLREYLATGWHYAQIYEPSARGADFFAGIAKVEPRDATQAEIGRVKGEVLRLGGRPVESRDAFIIPYLRGERDPALLASLGLLESLENREDRALKFLDAAAKAKAERPRAYLELAKLRLRKTEAATGAPDGPLDDAQVDYILEPLLAARGQPPPMTGVYSLIGDVLLRAEQPPDAARLEIMLEGVRHFPNDGVLIYKAALLYANHGDPERARTLIGHGLKISINARYSAELEKLRARLPGGDRPKTGAPP
ncbi:hypothetical protein OH491_22795 [Termitidicoccus mucosus]|uniref:tetratricopeptide repeat protein n=1 Tax=Termitidicoccus mucosus TaxID=1184151 RepID=UPI0011AB7FB9